MKNDYLMNLGPGAGVSGGVEFILHSVGGAMNRTVQLILAWEGKMGAAGALLRKEWTTRTPLASIIAIYKDLIVYFECELIYRVIVRP
jgi:hypothetical protein